MKKILGDSDGPSVGEAVIKAFVINSRSDGLISIYDHSVEEAAGVVSNNGDSDGAGSDFGDIWEFREPNIMSWGYLQVENICLMELAQNLVKFTILTLWSEETIN